MKNILRKSFHKFPFLFLFFTFTISAQSVSVSLPTITRASGSVDEYINLTVGDLTDKNITSFQFRIYYDKNVIYLTDATSTGSTVGGISSPTINPDTANGQLRVAWASATPLSGSGTLLRIKVQYRNLGTTSLSFINPSTLQNTFIFYDANGTVVSSNTTDGSVTVGILPASIAVSAPNGGEVLQTGSQYNITWTSNNVTNLKIEYSTNNGTVWDTIIASTAASTGMYAWTVPNTPSTQALVRIIDAADSTVGDTSNAVFTISSPSINVITPNGGENWFVGSTHYITWTSVSVSNVKIELSTDDGASWTILTLNTPSNGSYSWTVPNYITTQARIKITNVSDYSITDQSNSVFSISEMPTLNVTSPNGGENWYVGSTHNITWNSVNVSNVKIEYSINNGTTWDTIVDSTLNSGSYEWIVPNTPSGQALVRITNLADDTVTDESDSTFVISTAPTITVKSPNGSEVWREANTENITWLSKNVATVMIEYSETNGAAWKTIVASTPSTGVYSWLIPKASSTQALVRISDVSNSSINDVSDSTFTLIPNTGIDDFTSSTPERYALYANYPNPFNPSTRIRYSLPFASNVVIEVYNITGQKVSKIINGYKSAGNYEIKWNSANLSSGVYIYMLKAQSADGKDFFQQVKKMTLLK